MGISFSTNTLGINNINLFGALKVGDDQIQTLSGLFANVKLDEGPFVKGFFAETNVLGNAINIIYTTVSREADNLQARLRLRLFKDDLLGIDLNLYHNITNIYNFFKISRFGGDICWSFPEGYKLSVGVKHTPLFNTTTLELMCKANLWKSERESLNIDLVTNLAFYIRGPLMGQQNIVASLTVSYDMGNRVVVREKVLTN